MQSRGHWLGVLTLAGLVGCSGGYSEPGDSTQSGQSAEDETAGSDDENAAESADGHGDSAEDAEGDDATGGDGDGSDSIGSGDSADDDAADEAGADEAGADGVNSAATDPAAQGGDTETRTTSDGETIDVIIPEPAPTVEVPEGEACGMIEDGVVYVCQAGTYCLSAAEGEPGTCVSAPRPPRTDG